MKILFLDIDDTLVNQKKEIPQENILAIQKAVDQGHKIVICSGRPLAATLPIVEQLGLTEEGCYAIAFNGAQIYDCYHQKTLVRETLTLEETRYVYRAAQKAGIHVQTYDAEDTVLLSEEDEEVHFYCKRIKVPFKVDPKLPDSLKEEPVKCLFIELHDRERIEAFRRELEAWNTGAVNVFFSNQYFLECVKAGVSKGKALHWFCKYMGVSVEDTISAGDSENDLPMIEAAGLGCAMANGTEAVRKAADYITERDCDHGGVAEIIEKFMLSESHSE